MPRDTITIHVKLDASTFRHFAMFDTFRLKRGAIRPIVFTLILLAFSVACFVSGKEQSALMGSVLLVVGLGLPLVYFGSFFAQLNGQVKRQKLKPARNAYTLTLSPEGVRVRNDVKTEEELVLGWEQLYAAYRAKNCIYLYATPARAFLLPAGQADAPDDELWAMLAARMPKGKAKG